MNYQEFREEIINLLKKSVEEGICVTLHRNTKNNGIVRWAVSLKRKEDICVPTVYLESFYEEYESHKSTIYDIAMKIIEIFEGYRGNKQL